MRFLYKPSGPWPPLGICSFSKRKPNILSSLLRIRNGMNRLIENVSSINPLFARPSEAFNTSDNIAARFLTLSIKHLVLYSNF